MSMAVLAGVGIWKLPIHDSDWCIHNGDVAEQHAFLSDLDPLATAHRKRMMDIQTMRSAFFARGEGRGFPPP